MLNSSRLTRRVTEMSEPGLYLDPLVLSSYVPSFEQALAPLHPLVTHLDSYAQVSLLWADSLDALPFGLSLGEAAALNLYTREWPRRGDSLSCLLNQRLASERREQLAPFSGYLRLLLSALEKLPRSSAPGPVWRGTPGDVSALYRVGKKVPWWGCASCAGDAEAVRGGLGEGERSLFSILFTKGFDVSPFSMSPAEKEVVLPPGRVLEVLSKRRMGDGMVVIELKEIESRLPLVTFCDSLGGNVLGMGDAFVGRSAEGIERERLERERLENERLERERSERERLENERIERERMENERIERERLVREIERLERERIERERLENERIERERMENERIERERLVREIERLERERIERERLDNERIERERLVRENERIEGERLVRENERLERERIERERLDNERIERERIERLERERLERLESERIEKERSENQRLENERIERERIEKERLEKERIEQEKIQTITWGTKFSCKLCHQNFVKQIF
eukprot:TRINITY_DN2304_c0_g1_i4.p1 TRINITY_DN2304_c0_g1~~TRINITY_DN2304_c0_g1_i4.p1  ORF type:complete len:482 (+),score=154.44 TRINITY_DN2304_c0_g1_i4:2-1447(+)